ncbi:hypothetical protein P692DRAFT_20698564, partial [Suillus brevipes Sb2]
GQTGLHGAFLWRQVDTVVELKKNWRAKDDAHFVQMLNRIRLGRARKFALDNDHPSDYEILKTRLLDNVKAHSPEDFEEFKRAPVVVTRKFLRDAINESKGRTFAAETDQEFHIYYARDKIAGKAVTFEQQRRLWMIQTSHTNDAIGKLPLIPGMPVMITENAATSCKIVNGSKGVLKSITYDVDESENRYPVCAFVDIPESTLEISGLRNGVIPIFPVSSTFSVPTGEKTISVRRAQLPILPGWAFTDFKVQGSYLPKVVVDLAGAKSLQSIYVMLSRASQLRNIAILRWFSAKTLHAELQGDVREEFSRLRRVEQETREKY